jgi:site-specific DNA recombinase
MRGRRTQKRRISVAYCRVSTQEQANNGLSLDAQQARLEAMAAASNHGAISEVLVDAGFSGSKLDRPAMNRLLGMIERREVAAVFVVKLDRLSRSLSDMLELVKLCDRTETAVVSASETLDTSTAFGRAALQVAAVFAELERGMAGERTTAVLDGKRRQRQVYGNVPFGWRRGGEIEVDGKKVTQLVEVAAEQEALVEMRRMAANGSTLRAIGEMLESRNLRPRNGGHWQPASVRSILRSKMATEAAA